MAFSIRLTEQEKNIANSYARLHSISLGEAFKQALFEKIEDEYDIAVYEEAYKDDILGYIGKVAYKEYQNSGKKSRPINELWQELDL